MGALNGLSGRYKNEVNSWCQCPIRCNLSHEEPRKRIDNLERNKIETCLGADYMGRYNNECNKVAL